MLLGLAVGALITNLCLKPLVLRPQALHPGGQRILPVLAAFGPAYGERFQLSLRAYHRGYGGVYGGVSVGDRRWSWTAFLFTIAMGVSRIYLSVHYASDVLGGVLAGGIGGAVGYTVTLFLPAGYYTADLRRIGSRSRGRHQGG